MDGNISEMLQSVLSDPGAMKKLMGVAENLMGGTDKNEQKESISTSSSEQEKDNAAKEVSVVEHKKRKPGNDERIALISALRPYLSEERRKTADSLIKMLKMLKLADLNKLMKE